jgi:hypothetical protein
MPIKSFRGLMDANTVTTVPLSTNNGSTGYRIVKFEIMPEKPMTEESEHVVKIYTIPQTTVDGTIDFSDNTLIAAGFTEGNPATAYRTYRTQFFDNTTFNQDIYITAESGVGTKPVNYYIELEQIKLDLNENTVATLKDIRNIKA